MKRNKDHPCINCGRTPTIRHHVVPKSQGGSDRCTVALCHRCHHKIHGGSTGLDTSALIREGMRRLRKAGLYGGGRAPYGYMADPKGSGRLVENSAQQKIIAKIIGYTKKGFSSYEILERMGDIKISDRTIRRIMAQGSYWLL